MTTHQLIAIGIVWLCLAGLVATYATSKRFPWFPIFLSAVFLGFPLVLLAVTVGAAVHQSSTPHQ